jgi:hypothetical protein
MVPIRRVFVSCSKVFSWKGAMWDQNSFRFARLTLVSFDASTGCAVITGNQYQSRVAIQMLQELYKGFMAKHGAAVKTAAKDSLTKKAKTVLSEACKKYEDPTKVDKTSKILGQVDAVKGQMTSNIAGMLKNTEKAEDLAEKSDQLNEQASVFKKRSTDLKKQMAWKNLKMTLMLAGVVILILVIVLVPLLARAKQLATR